MPDSRIARECSLNCGVTTPTVRVSGFASAGVGSGVVAASADAGSPPWPPPTEANSPVRTQAPAPIRTAKARSLWGLKNELIFEILYCHRMPLPAQRPPAPRNSTKGTGKGLVPKA
jgi:hypothetical protein